MKILLIISGSIAAVKSYDLVRQLLQEGHHIRTVLTPSATAFVTASAMTTLTQHKCHTELFDTDIDAQIDHIALSRDVDLVLVAPATAHIMARIAHGLCDDLATTLICASNKPIYLAPAMNPEMWANPAHQRNMTLLEADHRIRIIPPHAGPMACGEIGIGRMAEVSEICAFLTQNDPSISSEVLPLKGKHIVITAGPTRERIDPVRYISNFSSGKQGYAIAIEALKMGASVHLITGPTHIPLPEKATITQVETAQEMLQAVLSALPADIGIFTAAICDWVPEYQAHKRKKQADQDFLELSFHKNPDILAMVGHHAQRPDYVIGFAAETENIIEYARRKLQTKKCDVIYANLITPQRAVFGADHNEIIEVTSCTQETLGHCSKAEVAQWILERIPHN